MPKYYLVTPLINAPSFDPGVTFITHGCKYLIRQADPHAYFYHISNTSYSQPDWTLLFEQADCLILAGIPLYDPSDTRVYWNYEIWDHIREAQEHGIPIVDLWGYSSHPFPLPDLHTMAANMLRTQRTKRVLGIQSKFDMIITRDRTAQHIASTVRNDVRALPCCSFWAHRYFNISPKPREFNCVTLRHRLGQEWLLPPLHALTQLMKDELPSFLLCHTRHEYWWAKKHLPNATNIICIYDPRSLLDFYSRCEHVISIRLHGSLPALSLGCQVINISIDSRSQALDLFSIPSIPYTTLKKGDIPLNFRTFAGEPMPPIKEFLDRFRSQILPRIENATEKDHTP